MTITEITIGERKIGPAQPCFIIAEAGVNHNGKLEMAYQLIDAAIQAGADAVKFQTFKAKRLVTPEAPKADYQLQTTNTAESQYEMLRHLELSQETHHALMAYCQQKGIIFMSSPFDEESANLLAELAIDAFKIPSGEITNWPLLEHIARQGKPIILSTGMSYLSEVDEAVRTICKAGNEQIIVLHCTSNYPANPTDVNLLAMQTMGIALKVPVGYSDHTLGIEMSIAALALGACVIEKHFTLDKTLPGPDHRASADPKELAALVRAIRTVEAALGDGRKQPASTEEANRLIARKSLVACQFIPAGTLLTAELLTAKRPGQGIPPSHISLVLGRRVKSDIAANQAIEWQMLI